MRRSSWAKAAGLLAALPALLPALLLSASLLGRSVPSLRDQADFFYPSHRYTAARILRGELPLWNALSGNGEPWVGGGQSEVFYPPALLFLLPNGAAASGAFLLFHYLLAYGLFFAYLRRRGSTLPACVAGASLYSFSGAAVSLSIYWNHFAGAAWIPGMAWAAHGGLKTRREKAVFAGCLGLAILAGSPEAALFGLALSAAEFFLAGRDPEELEMAPKRRHAAALAGALTLGILFSAVQLLPLADTLSRSSRRESLAPTSPAAARLVSAVETPSRSPRPWLPEGAGYLQSIYVALPALLLVPAGFLLPEGSRERLFWCAAAAGATLLAVWPLKLPFRYPEKLFVVALFAVARLAADGIDGVRFGEPSQRRRLAAAAIAGSTLLAMAWLTRTRPERLTLAAFGALAALAALAPGPRVRGPLLGACAAALAAHLASAGLALPRSAPLSAFEAPPPRARGKVLTSQDEYLAGWANLKLPDESARVRRLVDSLEGYTNLLFGIAKARTASALPTRDQVVFLEALDEPSHLVAAAIVSGCAEIRFPGGAGMARVLPERVLADGSLVTADRVGRDPRRALDAALRLGPAASRVLFVEGERIRAEASGPSLVAVASAVSRRPERVEYRVTLSQEAWLYRPQTPDPWWRARIDGKPAAIRRADGVFSAVLVPRGDHRVVWRYEYWPVYVGGGVSAIALLVLLVWLLGEEPPVRARRPR
jgi:hypothetical protein